MVVSTTKSIQLEPPLSTEVIVNQSELSAIFVYFVVTLITYVRTTIETMNQQRVFIKFTADRNLQSSALNDTAAMSAT